MLNIKSASILFITLLLTACGGGGSSSGGQPAPAVSNDGVYQGEWTATFSAPGIAPDTDTIPIEVTITGANITITDSDFVARGTLDANNGFNATTNGYSGTLDGITCTGAFTFAGVVNDGTVSGNSRARLDCSTPGRRPITLTMG